VERQIIGAGGSGKRLILILNKIDLVPGTPERVVELSPQILPNAATKGEQVCCEYTGHSINTQYNCDCNWGHCWYFGDHDSQILLGMVVVPVASGYLLATSKASFFSEPHKYVTWFLST